MLADLISAADRLDVASQTAPDQWLPIGSEHGDQISNGQLEFWDTTGFEGLYTLRLVGLQNSGGEQTSEVQVVVDNTPPIVEIIHPPNNQPYVKEDDELVSITAEAQDEWEMDRVEFYLDNAKLGESTVAPYSLRWTITMSDVVPALGPPVTATRVITNPDGTVGLEELILRQTQAEEYTRRDGTKGRRIVLTTGSGFGAIYDSGTLTETHTIYVKAFDRAGNETKSEPVIIRVMHKPKSAQKTSAAWPAAPAALAPPGRSREPGQGPPG